MRLARIAGKHPHQRIGFDIWEPPPLNFLSNVKCLKSSSTIDFILAFLILAFALYTTVNGGEYQRPATGQGPRAEHETPSRCLE